VSWRAARAFCGIDYSLLSRCTSRVKSAPLPAPSPSPPRRLPPFAATSSSLFQSLLSLSLPPLSLSLCYYPTLFLSFAPTSFLSWQADLSPAELSLSHFHSRSFRSIPPLFLSLSLSPSRLSLVTLARTVMPRRAYRVQTEREKYIHRYAATFAPAVFGDARSFVRNCRWLPGDVATPFRARDPLSGWKMSWESRRSPLRNRRERSRARPMRPTDRKWTKRRKSRANRAGEGGGERGGGGIERGKTREATR